MKLFLQKTGFINILLKIFYLLPIKKNRILCFNFNGKGYGESPKYIADYLLGQNQNFDLYWVVSDMNDSSIPKNINKVKYKTFKYFRILYTSKVLINNTRFGLYFDKRKNQLYIQTWHGCLALKKIENDALQKLPDGYSKLMKHDSNMIDIMISNSTFFDKICREAFLYNGKILKIGTPKNDLLINENQRKIKDKVCKTFSVSSKSVLVLYAPTFRNNYSHNPYDVDFDKVKKIIDIRNNSKNCKIIVKLHPLAIGNYNFDNNSSFIDANYFSDIQQLLLSCDLIITDYSSIMFDGLIANKPVILYAKDSEIYNEERGCYFSFEQLPFPFAKNNEELYNIIKNYNLDEMELKYKKFKDEVGLVEKGKACEKISTFIINYMNGDYDE